MPPGRNRDGNATGSAGTNYCEVVFKPKVEPTGVAVVVLYVSHP